MRIAFLTPEFVTEPYFAGGLAQYLGRAVPGLVRRGHDVEVFVVAKKNEQIRYEGALVHRVATSRFLPLRFLNVLLRRLGRQPLAICRSVVSTASALDNALRERARKQPFDVVQAASWMATGLFAVRRSVAPVVIRVSSYTPLLEAANQEPATWDRRNYHRLELAAMKRAAGVYGPSRFLAERISESTGIPISVVRPPFLPLDADADREANMLPDWPRYLLFFGRISRYKGAGILADAVQPLLSRLPELHLVIAGSDSGDEASRKLLMMRDAHPARVRHVGVLPPHQLRPLVSNAHCVVLPSLIDNLPNTCLEAMSLGRVVIGPNGVSFDELIKDGESGILFEPGSVESLQVAIVRAWELSAGTRENISRAARQVIDGFAPEVSLADLESFFNSVIG